MTTVADARSRRGNLLVRRNKAQAMVEFGIVLVVFLLLVFGIIDYGMVLSDWVSATTAASVGARQAAVGACFLGSATDPSTCSDQNTTSVLGGVMQSAPLLAASGGCENPPQPSSVFRCLSRVDIALINVNAQQASCEDVEIWRASQTALSGSTATVILTTSTSWPANSLVSGQLTFVSGANNNQSRTITANTSTSITLDSALGAAPSPGDDFEVIMRRLQPITAGWLATCSTTPLDLQMNQTLTLAVHALVEVPAPLPPLPTTMDVESSSTVRYEGEFVQ